MRKGRFLCTSEMVRRKRQSVNHAPARPIASFDVPRPIAEGSNPRTSPPAPRARAAPQGVEGNSVALGGSERPNVTQDFAEGCRALSVTPHVAQNTTKRSSRIDARTTHHHGYTEIQKRRKCVEEVFGGMKTVGLMRKTWHRGRPKVGWAFTAAAYNLVRIRNLLAPV